MVRGLPIIFGQRDYLQLLGFSPNVTIAASGCFLTSFVMIARYYGKVTDPLDLNKTLKQNNLYIGTDDLSDDVLTKVYPDIIYQESLLFPDDPPTPADLAKLKTLMDDPMLSVILEIDLGGGNTHFVVCVGVNGVVTIANPWDKMQEDFATLYGDPVKNIIKYIVYKGTPASVDQQLLDQLRQQRDNNWNLYQEQIATNQKIQDQISGLQGQIDTLNKKNNEQANEIINLNSTIQTMAGSNKDYASETLAAGQQENGLRDGLHAIANKIGIQKTNIKDSDLTEAVLANIDVIEVELNNRNKQIDTLKQTMPQKVFDSIMNPSLWQTIKSWIWKTNIA